MNRILTAFYSLRLSHILFSVKHLCILLFALAVNTNFNLLNAQTIPSIEWQKTFGGQYDDSALCIEQTTDGGYIIAGSSESNNGDVSGNHGHSDFWIVKLDLAGSLLWQKSLGGGYNESSWSIQQTTDGGYIVVGNSISNDGDVSGNHPDGNGYYSYDYWIVKLDSGGNMMWQECLGGGDEDHAFSVQQTTDNGFIIAGYATSTDGDVIGNHNSTGDYWVVKLSESGMMEWQKCLGGYSADIGYCIYQTTDGGYVVAGSSHSDDGDVTENHPADNGSNTYDYWITRLDTSGNLLWQKSFGGSDDDEAISIQQISDGNFIVAGYSESNDGDVSDNYGLRDFWVIKIDTAGSLLWQKSLGGSEYEVAFSIRQTTDGGFIIAGYTSSEDGQVSDNQGGYDIWIVKLNMSGNLVWQKCLGGTGYDSAHSIRETTDGGYIIAGNSTSIDGDVSGNQGEKDFWIVKLTSDLSTGLESTYSNSFSIYPNPVQAQLIINLTSFSDDITIRIYDLAGRIQYFGSYVSDLVFNNSFQLNIENLADRFYTIQITNNKTGECEVRKFVKMK